MRNRQSLAEIVHDWYEKEKQYNANLIARKLVSIATTSLPQLIRISQYIEYEISYVGI
jgi:hypothetical protein